MAERVSSERLTPGSESSSRRVWGQRPGQLAIKRDYDFHGPFLFFCQVTSVINKLSKEKI